MMSHDPYQLDASAVREPPTRLFERLRYLGPSFILSASIVGSGELIATTIMGAEAGFVLLWFIIFSCLVKVTVQLEFGKHAISSGESTMVSLNSLPGPRLGQANWSIWGWLFLMSFKMMQVGGIIGGVVLALGEFFPWMIDLPARVACTFVVAASLSLLVYRGYYLHIERACLVMIALFTLFTFASLLALQTTDMAISGAEFWSGLVPSIPTDMTVIFVAIGAFGITGVGGDEIMAYNYWLIEKGYAAHTGPRDDSPAWERRARGWIKIMYLDALMAMVAYTSVTAMFYLLGAAVLHRTEQVPAKSELISTLGTMYTESLGPWARSVFVVAALIVLYSTLFGALAAWTRMFSDAFGQVGWLRYDDPSSRRRAIQWSAWIIPALWGVLYLYIGDPAMMVIMGGLATVVILVMVIFAALYFRYTRLDPRLRPTRWYDAALWLSSVAILLVAALGVHSIYRTIMTRVMSS